MSLSSFLFNSMRLRTPLAVCFAVISTVLHAAGLGVTSPDQFSVAEGFEVELLYEVPAPTQGSWVSLTTDPNGRLIACDQYGGLFRIDVSGEDVQVEKLTVAFEGAQGLLCAFGSLYANVNSREQDCGVYRLTDTDGDDQYDQVEHLIKTNGGSEHGPHALILTPDQKRILMVAGNSTDLPEGISRSRVPTHYQEDHLLGRMPDARGHNSKRMAPGGYILSFNPDGSEIELVANGFRNHYDIALNRDGELFTYDADMEWDVGTPWYRPTRVNHIISGGEYGWRNGTGKWPAYYPDSFGASVDIGPGSPTGICFGYGTKFPAKYQNALFICDWSYGNIHAVHLTPDGSTYSGKFETFATAAPLPVTDIVVHPDGNLYFTVGGRKTQSGLYRVRYTGSESTEPVASVPANELAQIRRSLESMHLGDADVAKATAHLGHADRGIRYAARVALENQNADVVRQAVQDADSDHAKIIATIALARTGQASDRRLSLATLDGIDWNSLSSQQRIDLLRAYGLVSIRLGGIEGDAAKAIVKRLGAHFPTGVNEVDRELAQVLVALGDASATARIVDEMQKAPSQETQIHYALTLRNVTRGWNPKTRRDYFQWFNDIGSARGGMSFGGFLANIKSAAVSKLPTKQKKALAKVLNPPKKAAEAEAPSRPFVKKWTVAELEKSLAENKSRPNFDRGKEVFVAGQCYKCHRMGLRGGILGPNLTSAGGKFGVRDMLASIVEPDKEVSDQYGATQFLMDDGRVVVGRIVNMRDNQLKVMTNMLDPAAQTTLERDAIEVTRESKTSMMPSGLLDVFSAEEIADLIAYLRSGGQPEHPIYQKSVAQTDAPLWLTFEGGTGPDGGKLPGAGKHIVLVSGDHEYRSEEALPQLGKILSQHHGFRCTVLFAIDPETGEINPDNVESLPGLDALETADLMILGLRFRNLPDEEMGKILAYADAGKPMLALRTSTHPFDIPADRKYHKYSWNYKTKDADSQADPFRGGFGQRVFGETWVSHHGKHKFESTRGVVADSDHPIARGIQDGDIWGPTDVYGVTLPLRDDGHAVIKGQILSGMNADDPAITDGRNAPMMPIAWTRSYQGGRVFVTTMGSADDLPSEGVRRMIVNAAYWCLAKENEIKPDMKVDLIGPYTPTPFGFGGFIPGKTPADYDLRQP